MALPIAATPVLTGKEAAEFLAALHRDAKKSVRLTPTPKLAKAHALIKKSGEHGQKRVR